MTTYRFIANSVTKHIKENFDDANVSLNQVILWCQFYANRVKSQHIKKTDTSGAYITIIENIKINNDNISKYILLPKTIFDLEYDKGIDFLYYVPENCGNEVVPFSRCKPGEIWRLYLDRLEVPTPDAPVFYRSHEYIRLLGIEDVSVDNLLIGIYDTIDFFYDVKALDEPLDIGEEHMDIIFKSVLELARFGQLVSPELNNEGADNTAATNLMKQAQQRQPQSNAQ